MIRLQKRVRSEKNRRRMMVVAVIVILFVFLLSIYLFFVDLNMGISREQEDLVKVLQNTVQLQLKETESLENDHRLASPSGAATPVPMNLQ